MCLTITAFDSAQLLMDIAMVGVLKKVVQIRFKTLTSGIIKLVSHDWTLPLLKTKLREWKIDNEIINPQPTSRERKRPKIFQESKLAACPQKRQRQN